MKKKKIAILAASAVMSLSVAIGAAACGGSYELTDFIVNPNGVKLTYEVGEDVSLSGLVMTAKFNDDSEKPVEFADVKFYLGEEDITNNLNKITETKGQKKIKIVYTTEYGEDSVEITITVTEAAVVLTAIEAFSKPLFISEYEEKLSSINENPEEEEFEQSFFKNEGVEYYVVGDDNAFKFLPVAKIFNEETVAMETLARFTANSTVKMLVDTEYATLTKTPKADSSYVYEYYNGETLLLTEDAVNNEFKFEENAVGQVFKLSVKPDEGVYQYDAELEAVEFTVQIVDGYNVYTAGQLAVFDNTDRAEWTSLKALNGVANVTTNGVVLHQNTILTASDIPEAYQYTLADDYNVKYKDENGNVGTPEEFGLTRTFLKNQFDGNPVIYERQLATGAKFNFYGNYFDLDLTEVPLVASFQPTGMNESETWYGNDFSNTSLFRAQGQPDTLGEQDEEFNFYNLAMKGNAKAQQLVLDESTTGQHTDETLVYAGGLIGTKVDDVTASYDNVRAYEFFIALFAESKGGGAAYVDYNRAKVYDSFQDALFLWGNAHANVTNSYFKRAGGPLALMQHVDPKNSDTDIPTLTIDNNSVMEAYVTGSEIWFSTVGGASVIDQLRYMDTNLFNNMGKTVFKGRTAQGGGKMNMVSLLTCDASNVNDLLGETAIQGSVSYKGYTLDRMYPENPTDMTTGALVHGIMDISAEAPIFSFGESVYYTDLTSVYKLDFSSGVPTPTDATAEMFGSMQTAEYLSFYMGGLSVMFGLYPYSAS